MDNTQYRKYITERLRLTKDGWEFIKSVVCPDGQPALEARPNIVGVPELGWGTIRRNGGHPIRLGDVCTAYEAEQLFFAELPPLEVAVTSMLSVPVTETQFAALVSFAFDEGVEPLGSSAIIKRLNAGDVSGAADAFMGTIWVSLIEDGEIIPSPEQYVRRAAERDFFLTDSPILKPILVEQVELIPTPAPEAPPVEIRSLT